MPSIVKWQALISRNLIVNGLLTISGQRLPIPSTHIQLKDLARKNLTEYILFKMLI
jgi:hypothetical protein